VTLPLPSRRDEAWRYADLGAVARVWDALPAPERIAVPAGEAFARVIADLPSSGIVRLDLDLAAGATATVHALCADGDYGRIEVAVRLAEGARFTLGGAIVGGGTTTHEIVTHVLHAEPGATSRQTVRSVLAGQATGNFLGAVRVARDAQQTDGEQSVKAMLLDRGATANAVPQLEIFADDVKCAHGATVGELDAEALFYMAARGIDPVLARRLMLQAFLADAFADLDAREAIEAKATAALEALL
jgi:Fe-S cluster assembly protein SufD